MDEWWLGIVYFVGLTADVQWCDRGYDSLMKANLRALVACTVFQFG